MPLDHITVTQVAVTSRHGQISVPEYLLETEKITPTFEIGQSEAMTQTVGRATGANLSQPSCSVSRRSRHTVPVQGFAVGRNKESIGFQLATSGCVLCQHLPGCLTEAHPTLFVTLAENQQLLIGPGTSATLIPHNSLTRKPVSNSSNISFRLSHLGSLCHRWRLSFRSARS